MIHHGGHSNEEKHYRLLICPSCTLLLYTFEQPFLPEHTAKPSLARYWSIRIFTVDLTEGFLRRLYATPFVVPLLDAISLHVSA
jgi:hypothetical protein